MTITGKLRSRISAILTAIDHDDRLDRLAKPVAAAVNELTASSFAKNALSGTWIGHPLHPALASIPLGAWVSASVVDLTGGPGGANVARRLVALGVVSAVPTMAAGASDWSSQYGREQREGLVHGMANGAATVLQAASCCLRRRNHRALGSVVSLAALGTALSAAYLGGHLTFVRGVGVNRTAFEPGTHEWTDVAAEDDIREGIPLRVVCHGTPVALVRTAGRLQALSATCTHAGGPLDKGSLEGCAIACPWHGSQFRLDDGTVTRGPASVPQPSWHVRVTDGRVEIRR